MVKMGDKIRVTGYRQQGLIPIGTEIMATKIISQFNAIEHMVDGLISIWILPEDYEVVA